ncbi:MAG: hypothetical protein PHY88_03235 [Candidatus Omnitrophica bacterium]|nr:hypothetical protein [Candidatus Omnitrophota bacterium]
MAKSKFILLLLSFSLVTFFSSFAEDTLTITTYYPSPYGNYRELRAKRIAIGDDYIQGGTYDWEESDGDGGEIDYAADLVVEGNVGIGTVNPTRKLEIRDGDMQLIQTVTAQPRIYFGEVSNTPVFSWGFDGLNVSSPANRMVLKGEYSSWTDELMTFNQSGTMYLKGNVGIGTTAPTVPLHVVGATTGAVRIVDGNQSSGYVLTSDANGVGTWKANSGSFGDWEVMTPNVTYQASTDGFVVAKYCCMGSISGYTDSSSTPSRIRAFHKDNGDDADDSSGSITMPVRKGDYWKVVLEGSWSTCSIYWLPLGTS